MPLNKSMNLTVRSVSARACKRSANLRRQRATGYSPAAATRSGARCGASTDAIVAATDALPVVTRLGQREI